VTPWQDLVNHGAAEHLMSKQKSRPGVFGVAVAAAVAFATLMSPTRAHAAFHLWAITEVYSNQSGSLQFIEMVDNSASGFNNFTANQQINVFNSDNSLHNMYTVPSNIADNPLVNSLGHMLLFGTAGIQTHGGPVPDFIIPDGFLFTGGGTLNFFGLNGGTYPAMPTDGLTALTWPSGTMPNLATNFNGNSGQVNGVPEPSALILTTLAVGLGGIWRRLSRRRAALTPQGSP
jgi:hypothetical protein